MKKRIIISIGILLAATAAVLGGNHLLSFHKVTFTLEDGTSTMSIYDTNGKEVKKSLPGGSTFLREGKYYIIPSGEDIASDKINFTVEKENKNITVNPPYSKQYLEKLLEKERAAIETAIASKYPSLISGYTIESGTLYERGDWYGGLLAPKTSDKREQKDPYRIVLRKKNGSWEVVRRPEYILTASRYKEVPIEILRAINKLVQQPDS